MSLADVMNKLYSGRATQPVAVIDEEDILRQEERATALAHMVASDGWGFVLENIAEDKMRFVESALEGKKDDEARCRTKALSDLVKWVKEEIEFGLSASVQQDIT